MLATSHQNNELRFGADLHLRNLLWIIDSGLGGEALCRQVSAHISKSQHLPIIGGTLARGGSNVTVTHLGNNFHSHICAVALEKPIYPNLLYPIAGLFGGHSLSGHGTSREIAIPNFEGCYHDNRPISEFSMEGDSFQIACALRYLHIVSELDGDTVQDVCLRKTSYGKVSVISGNHIDEAALLRALKLMVTEPRPYSYPLAVNPAGILSGCTVTRFGHGPCEGHSVVAISLKDGVVLPSIPADSEVFVPFEDTALAGKVSVDAAFGSGRDIDRDALELFPSKILGASSWNTPEEPNGDLVFYRMTHDVPYPVDRAVRAVRPGAHRFSFKVPNELDALLLAKMLDQAVSPIVSALRPLTNPMSSASFGQGQQ